MGKGMLSVCGVKQQVVLLFLIEIILIVLIGTLTTYGPEANANLLKNHAEDDGTNENDKKPQSDPLRIYPMYQDVHVMIWIGFGFLMTFLKRYGQSAIGLTFLIAAVLVQVALICEAVLHFQRNNKAYLSSASLLSADVAVAAPLISMGALLGKTTYMQLVFMGIIELIVYTINKYIGERHLMPFIQKRLRIHDTCGVHNLHGMPGVLAGIFGAIMAALATQNSYDYSLYEIFPARAPSFEKLSPEMRNDYGILPGRNRTAIEQASYQILALAVTLLMATVSGLITGLVMRTSVCGSIAEEEKFDDAVHWELEEEEEDDSHKVSKIKERNNRVSDQLPMGNI